MQIIQDFLLSLCGRQGLEWMLAQRYNERILEP